MANWRTALLPQIEYKIFPASGDKHGKTSMLSLVVNPQIKTIALT